MRPTLIIFIAAGSLALGSCGNNGEKYGESSDTSKSTSSTSTTVQPVTESDATTGIPQPARTNFESRYPQASNVKWAKYEPTTMNDAEWNGDWMTNLDTSDYQVNFNWDGMDYIAWYDNGEWVGSTARMPDNSKLPKAVNDAIHERYSDYTIKEVDKENDKNRTVYEVELEKGKDKLKLHYDENGEVVKAKGKVGGEKIKAKEDSK